MIANSQSLTGTGGQSCGCGGSSAAGSATCSCNGAGCVACATQSYVRPNFFAGQLLTEDDLQSLSEYVVAKNRLHNRHLFGPGIVCGLEVICQPCGNGQVTVQPGYALDCCGNDLVLSCATTLNLNAMIRDLRLKLLGYECGDPCPEEVLPCTKSDRNGETEEADDSAPPTRHYCLYLRWCEERSDPVSPYSTGDDCAAQVCLPTRIREGVRFELRCRQEGPAADDLFARLCACLGDLAALEKSSAEADWHVYRAGLIRVLPPRVTADNLRPYIVTLQEGIRRLQGAMNLLSQAPPTSPADGDDVLQAKVRGVVEAALGLAAEGSRFYALESRDREELAGSLKDSLSVTTSQLKLARDLLNSQAPRGWAFLDVLPSELERRHAGGLFDLVERAFQQTPAATTQAISDLSRQYVNDAPFRRRAVASYSDLREWLLDRLDRSPHLADCSLRDDVAAVRIPVVTERSEETAGFSAASLVSIGQRLAELVTRYLKDCFCFALNPVCQPCDDLGVLVACLEVRDCKIVRICNLERSFVLTPTAIRYWLPQLRQLGDYFEQFCCPTNSGSGDLSRSSGLSLFEADGRNLISGLWQSLAQSCGGRDQRQSTRTFGALASLLRRNSIPIQAPATGVAANPAAVEPAAAKPLSLGDLGPGLAEEIKALIEREVAGRLAALQAKEPVVTGDVSPVTERTHDPADDEPAPKRTRKNRVKEG